MNDQLTHLRTALVALGTTDRERAAALGLPLRTFVKYKHGTFPSIVTLLAANPRLLEALLHDAQRTEEIKCSVQNAENGA